MFFSKPNCWNEMQRSQVCEQAIGMSPLLDMPFHLKNSKDITKEWQSCYIGFLIIFKGKIQAGTGLPWQWLRCSMPRLKALKWSLGQRFL